MTGRVASAHITADHVFIREALNAIEPAQLPRLSLPLSPLWDDVRRELIESGAITADAVPAFAASW